MSGRVIVAVALAILAGLAVWYVVPGESPAPSPLARTAEAPRDRHEEARPEVSDLGRKSVDTKKQDPEFTAWANGIKAELIRRDDAESLIVAALLTLSNYAPDQAPPADSFLHLAELLKKASSRAPSNPAVQWLAWLGCAEISERKYPCDTDAFARALRSADPRNATPLVAAVDRARQANDSQALADALAAVEASGRFSNYGPQVESMLFTAIESVRIPPPRESAGGYTPAQQLAIGASAWMPLPRYRALVDACDRRSNDSLAGRCLSIAKQLRSSDNVFSRRIGLTMAERLTPFGSTAFGEIGAERRTMDWLAHQISDTPIPPNAMLRLLSSASGEVELWQAWLRENNLPTTPPEDWEGK